MSELLKDALKKGTIPLMSDEGMKDALETIIKKIVYGENGDVSRTQKLSTYKESKISPENIALKRKVEKFILWANVEAVKEDLSKMTGSPSDKVREYYETHIQSKNMGKIFTLTLFECLLELNSPEEYENFFINNGLDSVANAIKNLDIERTGNENAVLYCTSQHRKSAYDYRIYLNSPDGETRIKFLKIYAQKCIERRIPYYMKGMYSSSRESFSLDKTIFYCHQENLQSVLEILEEIKVEHPELIESFGSPITSALNYSYYGVCHRGAQTISESTKFPMMTYNDVVNRMAYISGISLYANVIQEDSLLFSKLTDEQKISIKRYANIDFLGEEQSEIDSFFKSNLSSSRFILDIVRNNPERFKHISLDKKTISTFQENFKKCASLINFGDLEHTDAPICFTQETYREGIKLEQVESIGDTKEKKQSTLQDGLGDFLQLKLGENAVNCLCGDIGQLKASINDAAKKLGVDPKIFSEITSRDQLERLYIRLVGIDSIARGRERIKEKESRGQKPIIHRYENSLEAERHERGKQLYEKIMSLEDKEERKTFARSLSKWELEDAHKYRDFKNNIQNMAETTVITM